MRAVLFCNEMLGLGHLGFSIALGRELASGPGDAALIVTGSPAYETMNAPARVEIVKIETAVPGADSSWQKTSLRPPGDHALSPEEVTALRAKAYLDAVEQFSPDALIVDYRPLGRDDDIVPALKYARELGTCTVALGIWDSDDSPEALEELWTAELLTLAAELYDLAFVYGAPEENDVRVGWLREAGIPVHVTGFVGSPPASAPPADLAPGYLLAMAGGGVDGFAALDAVLSALRVRPIEIPTVLVTGPLMPPADAARLRSAAEGLDVTVFESRGDIPALLAGARAVISMAGYSTTAEVLASGKPALMVPRAIPREEQLNRAKRLAASGLVAYLDPRELTTEKMRAAIDELLSREARAPERLSGASDVRMMFERSR